jgi:hypothetical protein
VRGVTDSFWEKDRLGKLIDLRFEFVWKTANWFWRWVSHVLLSVDQTAFELARQPDPSPLVAYQPVCFNIGDIESRLPLRSDNSRRVIRDLPLARQNRLDVWLPSRLRLELNAGITSLSYPQGLVALPGRRAFALA